MAWIAEGSGLTWGDTVDRYWRNTETGQISYTPPPGSGTPEAEAIWGPGATLMTEGTRDGQPWVFIPSQNIAIPVQQTQGGGWQQDLVRSDNSSIFDLVPYAAMGLMAGGVGGLAFGAGPLAAGGAGATEAGSIGAYGGMDAGAVAGADYGTGAAGLGGAGAGGVEVGAWPGTPQPVNEGPFMVNPSPGGPVQTLPDMPLGGNVTAGPGAVDLTASGAGAGAAPGFGANFDAGPYGGFDPTADYTGATAPGASPIISSFGGPQDNFGLAPPFMSGGQGGIPGMGGGSPLNSILNGTDWLGLGSDILGYAGQREYQKDLLSALNRAIDYSDPAFAQRPQYQQQYANMQTDPNWMNQGFLGNIQNEALRATGAQNASQGYMGSGNILHDLTRTAAETTSKYALPYMEQIGQAGGLLGGRQNASQAISSLGQAAGQAGLGQNYALGSALGRLPRQGVNSTINSGINSVLSGLGML